MHIFVTKDGGLLCQKCVNTERPEPLDPDCPDHNQWWIIGAFKDEAEICSNCGKTSAIGASLCDVDGSEQDEQTD